MLHHVRMRGGDRVDLGVADALAGELAGEGLQSLADLEQVAHVLVGQLRRARPAMRQELHEPFRGQHLQRLAQRRARNLEPLAQIALGNPRARRDFAVEQDGADAVDDLVVKHGSELNLNAKSNISAVDVKFQLVDAKFCIQKCKKQKGCEEMDLAVEADDLVFERDGGIGRITFNRPQARNAFTFAMYERLAGICEEANRDHDIKVLVLRGAGDKAFASGTDINQFREFKTPQDAIDYENRIDRVLTTLEQCRVPTIAAINGFCTGGGAGIAAACDLRIGTRSAKIGFPIARTLGNCLSMSNVSRLTALIGAARVKDLIFTARLVDATEAASVGLLGEVVDDLAALERRADEVARLVASHAPLTLNATKQAVGRLQRRLAQDEGEDLILMCYTSQDFREGLDAFLNKRAPQWRGQ